MIIVAKSFLLALTVAVVSMNAMPGALSFKSPIDISSGSVSGVSSLDAADINNDGFADVVVIEGGKHAGGRMTLAWFESPGKEGRDWVRHDFNIDAPLRSFLGAARLADMDGDGDVDLVLSSDNHSGADREADLYIFFNQLPAGDEEKQWSWETINEETLPLHHINDMEIADMDGDGSPDVIVRSLEPNQIHIFFQNTGQGFEQKTIDTELERSEGLAVGDLDGDGMNDISFTGYWLRAPEQPRSQSYGKFAIDADYHTINQNTKEAIGDMDGDGSNDVILAPAESYRNGGDHDLAWYKNPVDDIESEWPQTILSENTNNIHTVRLADIDNDGDLDAVTGVAWGNKSVRIFFNDGKGGYNSHQTVSSDKGLYSGVLADVDGDGDIDIIGQETYANQSKPWLYENLLIK